MRLSSLRLGCVKYLNARPLIHGWNGPVDFDHPSALCRKLADGELDVALVSSFEFLRNPIYTIVDDVAIAADGPVFSVIVAHREPVEKLEEIALDPTSATSRQLLRCLLSEQNLKPRLVESAPNESKDTAQLLIGDQAVRFRQNHERDYSFLDLGAEWKRLTGLSFVFALWLIRPGVSDEKGIASALRAQRDANLNNLDTVVAAQTEFSPEFCAKYFRDYLSFHFDARAREGLLRFRSLCEKHAILPRNDSVLRVV